jgi:hypothetical protein
MNGGNNIMKQTVRRADRVKTPALLLGASAVVAMGIIGVAGGGNGADKTAIVSTGSMSTGETTTVTYSGTVAPVVAVPPVKATPFGES